MQVTSWWNLRPSRSGRKIKFSRSFFLRGLLAFVALMLVVVMLINCLFLKHSKGFMHWKTVMPESIITSSNKTHFYLHGSWGNIVRVPPGCVIHPRFEVFAFSCPLDHSTYQVAVILEVMSELTLHFARCESCRAQVPLSVRKLPFNSQATSKKKTQRIEVILPPLFLSCRFHPDGKDPVSDIPINGLDAKRCLVRFDIFASLPELSPLTPPICFVALGDWGFPTQDQAAVIEQVQRLMERKWVKFIVLTGDNFYPNGVSNVRDPMWKSTFEDPFSNAVFQNVMFLVSLGNHDLRKKVKHQIHYGGTHPRWFLPDAHYGISIPLLEKVGASGEVVVSFDMLDIFVFNSYHDPSWKLQIRKGSDFFSSRKAEENHRWRLVVNHEAALSGAMHGVYKERNLPFRQRILPFINKYKIHMYLNGDDHILEVHHYNGTDFVTSGAGGGAARYQSEMRMSTTVWRPERIPGRSGAGDLEVLGPTLHCIAPFSGKMVTTLYDVSEDEEKVLYEHETLYRH